MTVTQDRHGQRGIVLVVVLWILASLTLLITSFNFAARSGVRLAGNEMAIARGYGLVGAAVEIAAGKLLERDPRDRWSAGPELHEIDWSGARLRIRISDETAFIDLNHADGALLQGLIRQHVETFGIVQMLSDNILDWRDSDHDRRASGAEDEDYRLQGRPGGAGDEPFRDVSEVRQVLGLSNAVYQQISPYLTVFGGRAQVNPLTAPRAVLASLPGISPHEVDDLIAWREQAGPDVKVLPPFLARFAQWLSLQPGSAYRLDIEVAGTSIDAFARAQVSILLTNAGEAPFRVLSWGTHPLPDVEGL